MVKNRWLGLLSLMPAMAMTFLDQSVLPVALPTIQNELNATSTELIWAVNSYLLATAVLVLACGKLCDRMGHRRAFCLGMLFFCIASVLCSASLNGLILIGARTMQGIGAAFMIPSSSAILMSLFSAKERGKATGINVSFGSIFLIVGPLIGGYLTENYSWRWIFWINIPLTLLGLILTLIYIPRSEKQEGRVDLPSFLYFVVAATLLVVILMQGRAWGWSSFGIVLSSAICLLAAYLFAKREKKIGTPFLDLSIFKHPLFKAVNLSICVVQFVLMITIFWAIFFQESLGWTPIDSGFAIFLCSVPVLFVAPFGGYLMDRFGAKIPIIIGFILLILSLPWIALTMKGNFWILLIGLFAFGIGISFILTPSYAAAMGVIPKSKAGIAFGMIQTLRSLSSALGVALIGSLFDNFESDQSLLLIQVVLAIILAIAFIFVLRLYYRPWSIPKSQKDELFKSKVLD